MSFSLPMMPPPDLAVYVAPSTVGLFAALIGTLLFLTQPRSQFQRVGKPWILSFLSGRNAMTFTMEKHIQEGYNKVIKKSGKPFVMKWWGVDYVFLPPKYLPDLKRADAHRLSFFENISEAFSLYASVGDLYSSDLMIDVVRRGINTRFREIIPLISEECDYAFEKEIGAPADWTPFTAAALLGKIMHRTTSRILIGPELCRDDAYLSASQTLSDSIFITGLVLSMLPLGPFRRPAAYLLSYFHRRTIRKAVAVVLPVVRARCDEFQTTRTKADDDAKESERLDAIQWSLEYAETDPKEREPTRLSLSLLHNLWAGSAAPGGLVVQAVFQVLSQPGYLEPLRQEAAAAFGEHGKTDKALNSMPLMDSFLRELNRVYPTGAVTCGRTITDPSGFRFHDGFELPHGTRVGIPALAIQTDPENFSDPLKMDGFRFAKLRDAAGEADGEDGAPSWAATTISETNLAFGYGKHACPGRFYAVRKAKLIFGKLITEYDLKWDAETRPPSLSLNGQFAPNQTQKIFLKKREV